jgi:hypothetical protein
MLHACFYTICLVFRYTSWHFYVFSGTNLLTSRHSTSFLFVRPPRSTSDDAPSPIKTPRREKPKDRINFLEHIAIHRRRRPEDWEGPEAIPGTLSERGITTGGLLYHPYRRRIGANSVSS